MTANPNISSLESTCSAGGFNFLWTPFSLVPKQLLDEETPDLWLNFLRDRIPHDQQIARVDIPSQGCVCLVELKKGGANTTTDSSTNDVHVIPFLINEAIRYANGKDSVMAIRQGERLAMAVIKGGRLQMANIFESSTKEQTLYWILSAYEQVGMAADTPLYIRCGASTRKLMDAHLEVLEF